jgi:alkylation response protein AidB-like acyl-CoA dehydrogenase
MNFDLTAEQRLLQATSRAWFAANYQPGDMRELLEGGRAGGNSKALAETGYLGALINVERGGGGLSLLELALICEQAGWVLADAPLVATAAHAVGVLTDGNDAAQALLTVIADAGDTAAVVEAAEAHLDRDNHTVTLFAPACLGAELAEIFIVTHEDATDAWVALLPGSDVRVSRETHTAVDPSRRLANIRCDGAPADVVIEGDAARRSIASGRRRAIVALASEDLGAASACLERSVAYAKERHAFGRPIGSFQAIKHLCVDAYIAVEQLRTLVWYAAWCERGEPASFPIAASAARAYAAETLRQCAQTLIQVHGGVGVTWEHDAHLYWRRAHVDRVILGDPASHREAVARAALAVATDSRMSEEPAGRVAPSSQR